MTPAKVESGCASAATILAKRDKWRVQRVGVHLNHPGSGLSASVLGNASLGVAHADVKLIPT